MTAKSKDVCAAASKLGHDTEMIQARQPTSRRGRLQAKGGSVSPSHSRVHHTTSTSSKRQRSLSCSPPMTKAALLLMAVIFSAALLLRLFSVAFPYTRIGGKRNPGARSGQMQRQRMVLLVGPHKSASTSVQSYLVKLGKAGVLSQHNWKWIGNERNKGFAEASRYLLMGDTTTTGERDVDKERSVALSLQQMAQEEWDKGTNLVAAAEFLDYIAFLSNEQATVAMDRMKYWLPEKARGGVEVVVMYRTPRASHMISSWKQQVGFRKAKTNEPWRLALDDKRPKKKELGMPPNFSDWLCRGRWTNVMQYNISTIISAQVNPFGVAHAYHSYLGANVTMIDMAGVSDGDTPSSVVCDVLQLPCQNGRLDDAAAATATGVVPKARNKRQNPTDLGMTTDEIEEAEEILRDMDCFYYCRLGDALTVLSGKDDVFIGGKITPWKKCCQRIIDRGDGKNNQFDAKASSKRLIDLGCRAYDRFQREKK